MVITVVSGQAYFKLIFPNSWKVILVIVASSDLPFEVKPLIDFSGENL